jgi:hypothetical protein
MFNLVYIEAISASLMESARFRFPWSKHNSYGNFLIGN